MKINDPKNLRAPALRLLIGLMPKKVQSAIWTFDQRIHKQISLAEASKHWKQRARKASYKIHSRGQRTNIEAALTGAINNWKKDNIKYSRHIILLTDGMVDISKSAADNIASRKRILQTVLPKIQITGAKIHTIALSGNADLELLKTLSAETLGTHISVDNTNSLHRIFLKLFEASTETDKLPITNNAFKVDALISDMTILLFKSKSGSIDNISITSPGNNLWSYKKHPANITWNREKKYDLITISKPAPGKWHLNTVTDPDNRVIVATNLKLKVAKLPTAILESEKFKVQVRLVQEGKKEKIQLPLLDLTKFHISQDIKTETSVNKNIILTDNGKDPDLFANDGVYSATLQPTTTHKVNQFTVIAKSPTFERIHHHEYKVYQSAATIKLTSLDKNKQTRIVARTSPGLFKPNSVKFNVLFDDKKKHPMQRNSVGVYHISVPKKYNGSKTTVEFTGIRTNGSQYSYKVEHILPIFKSLKLKVKQNPVQITSPKPVKKLKTAKKKKKRKSTRMISSVGWIKVIIGVLIFNILGITALVLYRWFNHRNSGSNQSNNKSNTESVVQLHDKNKSGQNDDADTNSSFNGEEGDKEVA